MHSGRGEGLLLAILEGRNRPALGAAKQKRRGMLPGFRLFLMVLPFLAAVFVFSYLPLYGWLYSFFDYRAGLQLFNCKFVGLKYFEQLVGNTVLFKELLRVLRNTFAMSFLGILVSPLPVLFAVMLTEARSKPFRRVVQTLSTLPNFISWIMVYSIIWAMFSVGDGFVNRLLLRLNIIQNEVNFLASTDNVWLTMLSYSIWKNLGWSAIMYLAAIASIDQEQYEAAIVDGAGRFRLIWHITIPGILPTFFVLLLLTIANFINNGMEQYFVFQNPMNKDYIEVLDLYVYNKGMVGNNIPFATAVSMLKSLVSIVLLFAANSMSKSVRGETII
jgi:putative aldouronate transport system permease protein